MLPKRVNINLEDYKGVSSYTDRTPYYITEDVFGGVQVILLQVNI